LKKNIPPSKFEIQEKYEPNFLQGLGALENETLIKKRMGGIGGRERDKFEILHQKCKTRKMFPLNPRKIKSWAWSFHFFKKF
jgi:hypothetical protein